MAHQRAWVSGNKLVDEGICLEGTEGPRGGKRIQSPLEFACFLWRRFMYLQKLDSIMTIDYFYKSFLHTLFPLE